MEVRSKIVGLLSYESNLYRKENHTMILSDGKVGGSCNSAKERVVLFFGTGHKNGPKNVFYIPFKYYSGTIIGTKNLQLDGTKKGLEKGFFGTGIGIGIRNSVGGVFF